MIVQSVRGRWREELPSTPWRWLLLPGWLAFRPLVAARGLAYDRGWRSITRLPVPVWSVGNLTAGGTGKTPLTRHLARWAIAHGLRPAILSRGYRADAGGANDEARTISECPVICDSDRIAGGRAAIAQGASCLILDDGFQHRRLQRDVDLVLIDATRPWGALDGSAGAVLPLGYLREGRAAVRRASALVLTRGAQVEPARLHALRQELAAYGRPLIEVVDGTPHLRPLLGTGEETTATLVGRPVVLVSGLGNPVGFERTATACGWQVCASLRFPDHHHYDVRDVATMSAVADQHHATLVVTGKDAVKLSGLLPAERAAAVRVLEVASAMREADIPALDRLLSATLKPPT